MFFVANPDRYKPKIAGPYKRSEVMVVRKDGSLQSVGCIGYLWCHHAKYVEGGVFVKVKAYGMCEIDSISSCQPIDEGKYLIGYYLEHAQALFIMCDDKLVPLQKFCPTNWPPASAAKRAVGR